METHIYTRNDLPVFLVFQIVLVFSEVYSFKLQDFYYKYQRKAHDIPKGNLSPRKKVAEEYPLRRHVSYNSSVYIKNGGLFHAVDFTMCMVAFSIKKWGSAGIVQTYNRLTKIEKMTKS